MNPENASLPLEPLPPDAEEPRPEPTLEACPHGATCCDPTCLLTALRRSALSGVRDLISPTVARAAHEGTSHTPERRGEQERDTFAATLTQDFEALAQYATTAEKVATLAAEFPLYRANLASRYSSYLAARAGLMSTLVAGPSNFPRARNAKRGAMADRRLADVYTFRERALDAIRKTLRPELRPIMAGDADAGTRLREKIDRLEEKQRLWRAINKAHQSFKRRPASLDAADLPEAVKKLIREYEPPYSWEPHPIAPYQLSNLAKEIQRCQKRLAQVEAQQVAPAAEVQGEHARLEDSPSDNRVRLVFPGKPDDGVRQRLKAAGFRWTPTLGCWQAYRNPRSLAAARDFAGIVEE